VVKVSWNAPELSSDFRGPQIVVLLFYAQIYYVLIGTLVFGCRNS